MTHLRRLVRAPGTYFVTSNTWERRALFMKEPPARVFLECLLRYRQEGHYLLHEFVLMPDHFHLLLTPAPNTALERALQYVKGGSSHAIKKNLLYRFPIWQTGFDDHRIRDAQDYQHHKKYILQNPVEAGLVEDAKDYAYCSAWTDFLEILDPWPPSAAEAAALGGSVDGRAEARPRQSVRNSNRILTLKT